MTPATDSSVEPASRLAVVVVNWNACEHLAACLGALPAAARGLALEVVVVDHASTDGSVELLENLAASSMPWLRLIACSDNPGFGTGAQRGIETCRGDWVAVLNPDVVPRSGSLAGLVTFLKEHPRAGVAGPAHLSPGGESLAGGADPLPGIFSSLSDVPFLGRIYRRWRQRRQTRDNATRCGSVRGACLVFRRQALDEIGGFPRDTFLYGEEILIGHRMAKTGYEVWYVPSLAVVHDDGASVRQRWSDEEVAVERRRVRIQVLYGVLSRPGWLVWNALAWTGLALQGLGSRVGFRRVPARVSVLRRLHRQALSTGRPVHEGTFR